jgi:2-hydroxy-3-keto-5-methylthiopentenyl-1-phosphate phosphatase
LLAVTLPPLPVHSIVIDFDGTICLDDVSDRILLEFVGPLAAELDLEYEHGDIGSRENLIRTVAHLRTSNRSILDWTLARFEVDPTFAPFMRWARASGLDVVVVSDGLGLHVEPMLRRAGIDDVEVITNVLEVNGGPGRLRFPAGHPVCMECGTCKMLAVLSTRARSGPVAYVGDGHSDRYGAVYSDLVYAKGFLAEHCVAEGIPFEPWKTFDDVRTSLERGVAASGAVDPDRCPGWREPGDLRTP